MLGNCLGLVALVGFTVAGCENVVPTAEPADEIRVVYVNGQPDYCIVVAPQAKSDTDAALIAER